MKVWNDLTDRQRRLAKIIIAGGVVACIAGMAVAAWFTMWASGPTVAKRMFDAASGGESIDEFVDLPSLKESMSQELTREMRKNPPEDLGAFAALADTIIESTVKAIVDNVDEEVVSLMLTELDGYGYEGSYSDWNTYEVRSNPNDEGARSTLILHRSNFIWWKIVGIRLETP